MSVVRVQTDDFDIAREIALLHARDARVGAVAAFIVGPACDRPVREPA